MWTQVTLDEPTLPEFNLGLPGQKRGSLSELYL